MNRCKYCGREIKFVRLDSGKWMPCDPRPVNFSPNPNHPYICRGAKRMLFVAPEHGKAGGVKLIPGYTVMSDNYDDWTGYVLHWSTCPHGVDIMKIWEEERRNAN